MAKKKKTPPAKTPPPDSMEGDAPCAPAAGPEGEAIEISPELGQLVTMVFSAGANVGEQLRRSKRTAKRAQEAGRGKRPKGPENPYMDQYEQDELTYYLNLSREEQQYIADTEQRIIDCQNISVPFRFKVLQSGVDDYVKAVAMNKLELLYSMDSSYPEYHKTKQWIASLVKLPINKYLPLPVCPDDPIERKREFVLDTRKQLDTAVYGHNEAKEHILRLLAQWVNKPDGKGMVIGIHGPPGCGKTFLALHGISKALKLPFASISLGGASDGSFLEGFSVTYEGSTYGRISEMLMKAGCSNPVMYMDELDKISETPRGDEITSLLIHMTDVTQNSKFVDRYFGSDVAIDLSRCLMIFSYNDESRISPILRDRMFRIQTKGYAITDKLHIARDHLLPGILAEHALTAEDVVFEDALLQHVVANVDEEKGVRNFKRALQTIVGDINLQRIMTPDKMRLPKTLRPSDVDAILKTLRANDFSMLNRMYV